MKLKEIYLDHGLTLVWENGERALFSFLGLRMACPCAFCVDEITGERKVKIKNLNPDLKPVDFEWIGNYGLKITWSDGHKTGIYPFAYLQSLHFDSQNFTLQK